MSPELYLASLLNNKQNNDILFADDILYAKANALVVAFVHSDDMLILSGALEGEYSSANGCRLKYDVLNSYFDREDKVDTFNRFNNLVIECIKNPPYTPAMYTLKTNIDDAEQFNIIDGEDLYSQGLVFSAKQLLKQHLKWIKSGG